MTKQRNNVDMDYVCRCNNCYDYLIDTNPQVNAKKFNVTNLNLKELVMIDDMKACPNCETDEYLMDIDSVQM